MPSVRKTSNERPAYGPDDVKVSIGQAIRDLNASSSSNSSGNADGAYDIAQPRNFAGVVGSPRPAGSQFLGAEEEVDVDTADDSVLESIVLRPDETADIGITTNSPSVFVNVETTMGVHVRLIYGDFVYNLRNGSNQNVELDSRNAVLKFKAFPGSHGRKGQAKIQIIEP